MGDSLFRAAEILAANVVISINFDIFLKHPDEGEQPRPEISREEIEYLENLRDEGIRLLNEGVAKLRAFKWHSIIDSPELPTADQAVDILLKISEYSTIV